MISTPWRENKCHRMPVIVVCGNKYVNPVESNSFMGRLEPWSGLMWGCTVHSTAGRPGVLLSLGCVQGQLQCLVRSSEWYSCAELNL